MKPFRLARYRGERSMIWCRKKTSTKHRSERIDGAILKKREQTWTLFDCGAKVRPFISLGADLTS